MPDEDLRAEGLSANRTWRALRISALFIVLVALAAAAAAFQISRVQQPIFEATVSLLSAGSQTGNQVVNNTLVSAPPLPQGALERALSSWGVLSKVIENLAHVRSLAAGERSSLQASLREQAANRRSTTFALRGRLDSAGSATYDLSARHGRADVAATLANLAAYALVDWDMQRGVRKVQQSRSALEAQLADVTGRLARTPVSRRLDRQMLLDQRSRVAEQLSGIVSLERAVSGTLSIISPALAPTTPASPRPGRNAVLAAMLAGFAASGLVLLRAALDHRISTAADLKVLGLLPLGEIPRVARRRSTSVLANLRRDEAAEAVAFLRTNLQALLANQNPRIILVTSASPGEGKSSIAGALAESFAGAGGRTLLIDADIRRGGQRGVWGVVAESGHHVNLPGSKASPWEKRCDLPGALAAPGAAQAIQLRECLHYLPAGSANLRAREFFSGTRFSDALKTWAPAYDLVVIDSPPALAVSDAFLIAPQTNGVVLVLEAGRTTSDAVRRIEDTLSLADVPLVGVVLNKIDQRQHGDYYGYRYDYHYRRNEREGVRHLAVGTTEVGRLDGQGGTPTRLRPVARSSKRPGESS